MPYLSNDLVLYSPTERWATISEDHRYRYDLGRKWSDGPRQITWVMLNPSIADAMVDDPTIRRCIGFSKRWGFDSLVVVNLYAFRSADPDELGRCDDPFGPENARYLDGHLAAADTVVAAWGAHPWATMVSDSLLGSHRPLYCLGTTKDGHPKHPMARGRARVPDDQALEVWRGERSDP